MARKGLIHTLAVSAAHPEDIAELTAVDERLHVLDALVVSMVEAVHQLATRRHLGFTDLEDLSRGESRRLLAENVFSGLQRGNCQGAIQAVRSTDENGPDRGVVYHLLR